MNAIEFGKFLASLRNEKKLTQEELADKLFIDKRKISRWECGMSIPDFETLTKLSEILDVTLYELSICKRLEKEKLSKKAINKFKNIKNFKNYKLRKKILIILAILLGIFFISTAIYTFKFYGTVEIYEFNSLDDKYILMGTYTAAGNYYIYNIDEIIYNENDEKLIEDINDYDLSIYDNNTRIIHFMDENTGSKKTFSKVSYYGKLSLKKYINKVLYLKIQHRNKQQVKDDYVIKFKFVKKYDNKLF